MGCADDSECQASEYCDLDGDSAEPACAAKVADDAACTADN